MPRRLRSYVPGVVKRGAVPRALAFLVLVGILCSAAPAAAVEPRRFFAEHLTLELAAVGSWRSSWAEERNPGFHIGGGGGEINFGLELDNRLGFLIGGRALFGKQLSRDGELSGTYADVVGQAIVQLGVSDVVRLGLGATAGRLWRCCGEGVETPSTSTLIFGGFLRVGVDFLPRTSLPRGISLWFRLGIDGHRLEDVMSLLPGVSMNMAVGVGMRL